MEFEVLAKTFYFLIINVFDQKKKFLKKKILFSKILPFEQKSQNEKKNAVSNRACFWWLYIVHVWVRKIRKVVQFWGVCRPWAQNTAVGSSESRKDAPNLVLIQNGMGGHPVFWKSFFLDFFFFSRFSMAEVREKSFLFYPRQGGML